MDLSLKKPDVQFPQDLPQDLSVKKPQSSGNSDHALLHHQTPVSSHGEKNRITSHQKTNSGFEQKSRLIPSLMEQKSRIVPSVMEQKSRIVPSVMEQKSRIVPSVMEQKSRIVPTLIEQKSRIIPDLDQYIRAMMDLKPTLADQHLRTLAHQKAKSIGNHNKKTAADVRSAALVIPKRSALVIPDPRNRTFPDQKTKPQASQARQQDNAAQKLKTFSPVTSNDIQPKEVLDLRKKHHTSQTITERLLSNTFHQNDCVDKDRLTFLQAPARAQSSGSSSALPPGKEETVSQKRRRKQECPRKRVKVDFQPSEETDPIFPITEEFLDKVTDAAQNGELRKGLDEYFGQTTQQATELDNTNAEERQIISDFAQDDLLKDSNGSIENDGSSSPASSADGLSPFQSPTLSSQKQKGKQSRISTSLQNREQRKALRLYGKEYTTPSGKTYPQRQVRDKDCSRCRYNCSTSISPQQRQAIFDHFWSLDCYVKRLYYYCQSIKEKPAKTMKHTRECSREYTFLVESERVRVCKGFYLATLDVSDKAVRIAMEKRKRGKGMWDNRGAHPPHNKTRPEEKDRVRSHIESVLVMDIYSKTCDSSPRAIPGQDLNVTKMHQDYAEGCKEEGKEPVSEDVYRKTFSMEYNLSTVQV